MTVFTATTVLSANSACFHFTRGRWQACPRGESAGRGILGEGAENIPLSSPTLDQHLQKTTFATFFYQNQKRSQTGLVLTWRVGEPLSCKRQRIRSSLSLSPQFFSNLHHKRILYLLHNEMGFDVISLQPETKLLNFQISSLLLLEHMLSRSCWKLLNLCCQQLIQLFKSGSK